MAGPASAGYAGTPLPRKLGIAAGQRVLVVAAPGGFDLGPLPGVDLDRRAGRSAYDVILAFPPGPARAAPSVRPAP